jgi:beta-N-acetylhexosaminidase
LEKRKIYYALIGLLIVGVGGFLVWYLYPRPEKKVEVEPPVIVKNVQFLGVESPWVDSLINNMSIEEKIGQLILVEADPDAEGMKDSLTHWITKYKVGGLRFQDGTPENYIGLTQFSQDTSTTPLLIAPSSENYVLKGNEPYPGNMELNGFADDSLLLDYYQEIATESRNIGINLMFAPALRVSGHDTLTNYHFGNEDLDRMISNAKLFSSKLEDQKILSCMTFFQEYKDFENDSLNTKDSLLKPYVALVKNAVPGVQIDRNTFPESSETEPEVGHVSSFLEKYLDFNGLLFTEVYQGRNGGNRDVLSSLNTGADMLIVKEDVSNTIQEVKFMLDQGILDEGDITSRVKKVLMAKSWVGLEQRDTLDADSLAKHFYSDEKLVMKRNIQEASITVVRNVKKHIPFVSLSSKKKRWVRVGKNRLSSFGKDMQHYTQVGGQSMRPGRRGLSGLDVGGLKRFNPLIIAINDYELDTVSDKKFIESLKQLDKATRLVVVNFKRPENLELLQSINTLVQTYSTEKVTQQFTAQMLFGGVGARGKLPLSVANAFSVNTGLTTDVTRLKYTIPEEVGLNADTLKKIAVVARNGIYGRAYPGCQILVAKHGKVIYNRSFGYHTYDKKVPIGHDHMFDLASVTKVAATTMMGMRLYEQGKYKLYDSLRYHLPDSLYKSLGYRRSTLSNITFQEVLIHKSGLPSGMPIIKYINYTDSITKRWDRYFCDETNDLFSVQLADSFFMDRTYIDSMWLTMNRLHVRKDRGYKYSDANFNLLYIMYEAMMDTTYDEYARLNFYDPLGMKRTCYNPGIKYPWDTLRIVPTEDEKYWRKQLLRGFVHDPSAALYGGVAGNAGLFSTANDMAVLFQMLLNGGTYGGKRYFKQSTVDLWTRQQAGSHRGLGFNRYTGKPNSGIAVDASTNTWGHTGFTGNSIWVDPDEELVYIFLSNRVYPKQNNNKIIQFGSRKWTHQAVYDAMKKKAEEIASVAKVEEK